jgi:hypothetical protein
MGMTKSQVMHEANRRKQSLKKTKKPGKRGCAGMGMYECGFASGLLLRRTLGLGPYKLSCRRVFVFNPAACVGSEANAFVQSVHEIRYGALTASQSQPAIFALSLIAIPDNSDVSIFSIHST